MAQIDPLITVTAAPQALPRRNARGGAAANGTPQTVIDPAGDRARVVSGRPNRPARRGEILDILV
jgi:hypothetical protein